jgi:UDP-GlcNAc:undecaprenyl-phosphate GlcNAc-1-phosphate transferase
MVTLALAGLTLFIVSMAIAAGGGRMMRELAPRVGLVDRPGGRKAHARVTPLGGGVAIWLAVVLTLGLGAAAVYVVGPMLPGELARHVAGLKSRHLELAGLMGLATVIMLMGLADDRRALSPWPRLLIQVLLAAVFVAVWGRRATLFLPQSLAVVRWATAILTVLWIVGLTNSFNFLDNMDGLAAGVGLAAALVFAAAQAAVGGRFVPAVLLVLAGALAGFLIHNAPPARLFMGDAGSNFLGFLLGTLTVSGTFARPYDDAGSSPYAVLAPLLVMAVPLYDTATVIVIRLREGRSPFRPDRCHFSHRLVERGLSPPRAVATIVLVTLTSGLGALLLHRLDAPGAAVIVAQTLCLLAIVGMLEAYVPKKPRPEVPIVDEAGAGVGDSAID